MGAEAKAIVKARFAEGAGGAYAGEPGLSWDSEQFGLGELLSCQCWVPHRNSTLGGSICESSAGSSALPFWREDGAEEEFGAEQVCGS